MRSILAEGKKEEIDQLLVKAENPFHILAFTETWLKPDNWWDVEFGNYEHICKVRPMD